MNDNSLPDPAAPPPRTERERQFTELLRAARRPDLVRRVFIDPTSPSIVSIARIVIITLLLVGLGGFFANIVSSLTHLFFVVVLSVFFAYLIDPIVQLIRAPFKAIDRERMLPRPLAIVIAYVIVFSAIGFSIASIAPKVAEQMSELSTNLPQYGTAAQRYVNDLNRRFERLRIPEGLENDMQARVAGLATYISAGLGNFLLAFIGFLPWLILVPVLAFFFLKDVNTLRLAVLRTFPPGRWRIRAELVLQDVNATLAAYTRAQLLSCLVVGVICTIAFYALGLKYALLLGILAGVLEFIPLLGPVTVAVLTVSTTAASDDGWTALYAGIFLAILRIVQDYVIYPRIVRGGIHLHPLVIILAVLAGEQVAGIAGVFLSIPIIAILTVLYRHMLEHQGRRNLIAHWFEDEEEKLEEAAAREADVPITVENPVTKPAI